MKRNLSSRRARSVTAGAVLSAFLLTSAVGRADTIPIEVVDRGSNRVLLDGRLSDWRRFVELVAIDSGAQVISGRDHWSGESDASVGFALARDADNLYLAAEVRDDQLIRTREHRATDDAVVFSLAVQAGSRRVGYDIAVMPGQPGSFAGGVEFRNGRSGNVRGARVVEDNLPNGGGFVIEVQIPWSSLADLRDNLSSLRGRVAYNDNDTPGRPNIETTLATGPGDGRNYEQLAPARGATNASTSTDLITQFRQAQGYTTAEPFLDRSANIAGDAPLERVVLFARYLVAAGPGIAGGNRYAFLEHPVRTADDLVDVAMRDVTGDGRMDVLLRARVTSSNMTREVLYVYGAPNGADQLEQLFAHELSRSAAGNRVVNRATYEQGPRIRVTFASNEGFTPQNFPRLQENGVLLPMLQWSEFRAVAYQWSDSLHRFELSASDPNPQRVNGPATSSTETVAGGTPGATVVAVAPADVAGVLTLFRQRAGIAATARPDFSAEGNVAEDRQPETVQIYGQKLVVAGARFMGGRSYYQVDLPEGFSILSLELADVTDDGQLEGVIRARRNLTVQVRGQALEVQKEFVLVYSFDTSHRGRVFAAEVSRRVGADSIVNDVRGLSRNRANSLTISPGRATGWTEQSYLFRDTPPQGFAPLLLPWQTRAAVVYRWNGTTLAPAP
jgi:hypothetical protein